jgi:regulation of enolase protein 1 (concanavalin A-like superfamily)
MRRTSMNLFEQCQQGQQLAPSFHWINQPESWGFDGEGKLTIIAPPFADFFRDPKGGSARNSAPYLYTVLKGDFTVSTRVEVDMIEDFDSACIMLMVDEENWAKLCFEFPNKIPTMVSVVTKGTSDDCNSEKVSEKKPYLRATRFGNCFAFFYSLNGKYWTLVRYFFMDAPAEIKVGVVGQSPVGNGCRTSFDYFEYSPVPVTNLRSGK